jgi:hypothetical protein
MVSQVAFHMSRTTPWVSTSGAIVQVCLGVLIMVFGMVFVLDVRLLRTRWIESVERFLNSRGPYFSKQKVYPLFCVGVSAWIVLMGGSLTFAGIWGLTHP